MVKTGKTTLQDAERAPLLLDGIDISTVAGLRDRVLINVMTSAFARIGASWPCASRITIRRASVGGSCDTKKAADREECAMSDRPTQRPGEVRSARAADGARLEYEVVGSGPPLVMLHGILSGRASFSRQRAQLANYHRLILLSARGHDGSDGLLPANYGAGLSGVDDLRTILDAEALIALACSDIPRAA
jgi:hypothetical protein